MAGMQTVHMLHCAPAPRCLPAPAHLCVSRKTLVGGSVWKSRIALPRAAAAAIQAGRIHACLGS
jgi:uncharacterized lipoprotein YbaY